MPVIATYKKGELIDLTGRQLEDVVVVIDQTKPEAVIVLNAHEPVLVISDRPIPVDELEKHFRFYMQPTEDQRHLKLHVFPDKSAAIQSLYRAVADFATIWFHGGRIDIQLKVY